MPRMRLAADINDADAPDGFTERVLQVRLADFWKINSVKLGSEHDVILAEERKSLAVAALNILKGVSSLHIMMGGSQTRFPDIIIPTFEAAVLLAYLCMDPDLLTGECENHQPCPGKVDPLKSGVASLKRDECMRAVHDAVSRLQMLADISSMAEIGAQALAQLLRKGIGGLWRP
ncbi:uncharacterized protein ATNIH1004_000166 [Aspergillus tanneri]|uniref:Uncharacterized protein n=1 Tax=Aspergillus tanneri TaxID=1220188 RepID=A0A5M9MW12_9EURO|nr:uncharacterized protein ATNIH1004_000166 [Aspergillus tanneri]KAA8651285.1 hypothetical protein ATNIH1004_000166 [Aspergillus tanneri]